MIYANVRRDSRYSAQRQKKPFPVQLRAGGEYIWQGGPGGQYRTSDLDFFTQSTEGKFYNFSVLTGCEQVLARRLVKQATTANSRHWLEYMRETLREGMQIIDNRINQVEAEQAAGLNDDD